MGVCSHGSSGDHSRRVPVGSDGKPCLNVVTPFGANGDVRVWKCSDCGREDVWGGSWQYYGSLQCRDCQGTAIDRVSCGCKSQRGKVLTP